MILSIPFILHPPLILPLYRIEELKEDVIIKESETRNQFQEIQSLKKQLAEISEDWDQHGLTRATPLKLPSSASGDDGDNGTKEKLLCRGHEWWRYVWHELNKQNQINSPELETANKLLNLDDELEGADSAIYKLHIGKLKELLRNQAIEITQIRQVKSIIWFSFHTLIRLLFRNYWLLE